VTTNTKKKKNIYFRERVICALSIGRSYSLYV